NSTPKISTASACVMNSSLKKRGSSWKRAGATPTSRTCPKSPRKPASAKKSNPLRAYEKRKLEHAPLHFVVGVGVTAGATVAAGFVLAGFFSGNVVSALMTTSKTHGEVPGVPFLMDSA